VAEQPYFPLVCRCVLNRDTSIPLTFVAVDLLRADGHNLTSSPYTERRVRLEALNRLRAMALVYGVTREKPFERWVRRVNRHRSRGENKRGSREATMGISLSILLIAVGAILAWAVNAEVSGIDLQVAGIILVVVGAIGFVASLIFWSSWGGFGGRDARSGQNTTVVER
jgi:hypothetical protein